MQEVFLGHHGDVGLWKIDKLPKDIREVSTKILWNGENGNFHRFTPESDVKIYDGLNELVNFRFFEIGQGGATITHEEHKTADFQPGDVVKIKIERSFNPFTEEISKVED